MSERKRLSNKWPSNSTAYDGRVRLDINLEMVTDPVQTEMTPMQAMTLGLSLIHSAKNCLQEIANG